MQLHMYTFIQTDEYMWMRIELSNLFIIIIFKGNRKLSLSVDFYLPLQIFSADQSMVNKQNYCIMHFS